MEKNALVKSTPLAPAMSESAAAAELTAQYRRAEGARGAFVREAVAFGAMMIQAEAALVEASLYLSTAVDKYKTLKNNAKSAKNGRWGEGRPNCGLEDWLADHCPEINYKTAMSYKSMAAKMIEMMGGGTPEVMAALRAPEELTVSYEGFGAETESEPGEVETVSAEVIETRERLFGEAASRRKLEQLWLAFEGRGAVGRPRGSCGPAGTGPFPASGLRALTQENAVEAMFLDLTKLKIMMDKRRAVLMKYAGALKARHPNACAAFAQVAKDYSRCFSD